MITCQIKSICWLEFNANQSLHNSKTACGMDSPQFILIENVFCVFVIVLFTYQLYSILYSCNIEISPMKYSLDARHSHFPQSNLLLLNPYCCCCNTNILCHKKFTENRMRSIKNKIKKRKNLHQSVLLDIIIL